MKKIKYIMLAVVLCLGLIGGAYAYWTDQVVISGSVTTGDINVIFDATTDARFFSSISDGEGGSVSTSLNPSDTEYLPGNPAVATLDIIEEGKKVTLTITKAFPWLSTSSFLTVKNTGTVPVKIDGITFSPDAKPNMDFGQSQPFLGKLNASLIAYDSEVDNPFVAPSDVVLAEGETVQFILVTHVLDGVDYDETLEYTVEIDWVQFNALP